MLRTRLRDFDWTLLAFVLIMSVISVLEIRSATATTKFHGFQVKQLEFIAFGLVLMFVVSLVDYHRLLDIAPTLMDLAGYEVPEAMQGRSLVAGLAGPTDGGYAPDDEAIVRDRLSGLGYIG